MSKVYEIVTDKILTALENGTVPWRATWTGAQPNANFHSKKPYRGINVFLTAMSAFEQGFTSPWWLTKKQILARCTNGCTYTGSGRFRKCTVHTWSGPGTLVVFFTTLDKKDKNGNTVVNKKGNVEQVPMLRYYKVWNAEQITGITFPAAGNTVEHTAGERHQAAADMVAGFLARGGPNVRYSGSQPCYIPALDTIEIPPAGQFESLDAHYRSLFHELGHSTAHSSRLDRDMAGHFGSHAYGREELVAEMTAAFCTAMCGITETQELHSGYVDGWLRVLREDKYAVVWAANRAQKAADLISGTVQEVQEAA